MPALLISKGGRPVSATPSRTTSPAVGRRRPMMARDRKSTRLNSSHLVISYAVFCLKKKKNHKMNAVDAETFTAYAIPYNNVHLASANVAVEADLAAGSTLTYSRGDVITVTTSTHPT